MITPDDMRNLGIISVAEMINQLPSQAASAPAGIDEALLRAALTVMPPGMTEAEVAAVLAGGSWRQDQRAIAVSLPQESASQTFVFVRQADGSYAATDASRVVANAAFGFFGWPAAEYERYETEPLRWQMSDSGPSLLYVQVRAWREGQRYTVNGHYLVYPDGTVTPP